MNSQVINYFQYLRDVSRKIAIRNGFEKVLISSPLKGSNFTVQVSELTSIEVIEININSNINLYKYLKSANQYLQKSTGKQLFLGVGTVTGKFEERVIAAPLLIIECEIEDEKKDQYLLSFQIDTLSLNYDLLATLLYIYSSNDEEGNINNIEYYEQQQIIQKAEELLSTNKVNDVNSLNDLSINVFDTLSELKEFQDIIVNNNFAYDFKKEFDSLLNHKNSKVQSNCIFNLNLRYINANHLFIGNVPDQLTTYQALELFIEQLKRKNDLNNSVLQKLINKALEIKTERFTRSKNFSGIFFDTFIPIPLSDNQKLASSQAWNEEVSYIQGPPGTGKSHTISALALSGILQNKKVLIVSQKPPALQVVNSKINPYLENKSKISNVEYTINGVNYFDRDARIRIREYLSTLILLSNQVQLNSRIQECLQKWNETVKLVKETMGKLMEIQKNLSNRLELQYEHWKTSKDFSHYLTNLRENYENSFPLQNNLKRIHNKEEAKNLLKQIETIRNSKFQTVTTELFKWKLSELLKESFNVDNAVIESNNILTLSHDLFEINLNEYTHIQEIFFKLSNDDNDHIRRQVDKLKKNLFIYQQELLKVGIEYSTLKHLNDSDYIDELQKLKGMLWNVNSKHIQKKMSEIDFNKITNVLPLWSAEIRNLGRFFPLIPQLFDLVIVDEASQVNLAEILPVFYRAKRICIVGDHKQLNLKSTGLGFQLSKNFDLLKWNQYNSLSLDYTVASQRHLTVTQSSILDFVRGLLGSELSEVSLNEHFRSAPLLAKYTNKNFYENKLSVMTETPDKAFKDVIYNVTVEGKRNIYKQIPEEAAKVIEIIRDLTTSYENRGMYFNVLPEVLKKSTLTIGIISMIRQQCNLIEDLLSISIDSEIQVLHNIFVGTPEEFQGNERDIMIFSLALDQNSSRSRAFYQDAQRLNVATSRAKSFMYIVKSNIPNGFDKINDLVGLEPGQLGWKLDHSKYDSEFEYKVYNVLSNYVNDRNNHSIKIFNQVKSCGQMRLDFVLFNENNNLFTALEVDGCYHFINGNKQYSVAHNERINILKRAGWKIISTPYYKWYSKGWLNPDNDLVLSKEIHRIYKELDATLGITN
jgi:hypothetical protein